MNKVLDARDKRSLPRISEVMESMRMFFDDIEAYTYMSNGEVILRLEYELIVIRIPVKLGLRDLASYLFKLGAQVYRNRRGLDIVIQVNPETWLALRAATIHVDNGWAYIAIEPRKILSEEDALL